MIESNMNNQVSAALRQAQSQDVRSQQNIRARDDQAVEEAASSQPMAASNEGAAAAPVSAQPSDVVTRLGETTEQVPLYESNRPAGSIIRPAIELAQQAAPVNQQAKESERVAQERQQTEQAVSEAAEPANPAKGRDPSTDDVQNLV
ncbi:hypothetical protein [Marinospirillum sp.]|uniref:hypothetical protein n=1 Tax=Marinospirillum sp. TaxID=2183934 RepID=UPI003A862FA7